MSASQIGHCINKEPIPLVNTLSLRTPVVKSLIGGCFLISNTSSLFLAGSPLGVFLHLDQAQIMPRKGRERTMREYDAVGRPMRVAAESFGSLQTPRKMRR